MKHKIGYNALSRNSAERKALKRNMVTSLFKFERIETTKAKAKEVQRLAEKMITRAKVDSVHNRRQTSAVLFDEAVVNKLFTEIAPLFAEVPGGYTRIIKTQTREGDAADMVILELTRKPEKKKDAKEDKKEAKKAPAKKAPAKKEAEPKAEEKAE